MVTRAAWIHGSGAKVSPEENGGAILECHRSPQSNSGPCPLISSLAIGNLPTLPRSG